jgi:tellurite resistance protein
MPSLIGWAGLILGGLSAIVCALIATCVIVVEVTDWQHDRNLRRRVQDHQRQDELTAQVDGIYQFERQLERSDEFYELDREWCRTNNIAY